MKHLKNCHKYITPKANWNDYKAIDATAYSDFWSWAMFEAFARIGLKDERAQNWWCWSDGYLMQRFIRDNKTTDEYLLGMTANGILFVRHYTPDEKGELQQTGQAVIKPI